MRWPIVLAAVAATPHDVVVRAGSPSVLKVLPISRIADEIYEAERSAQDLQWKVGNSTEEKSSLQWFMASAMKELTTLTKTTMNTSVEGSLSYQAESCLNRTEAKVPAYNKTKGLLKSIEDDATLAPQMLEAEMYLHFESQTRSQDLTKEIGRCEAKCPVAPSSFLDVRRGRRSVGQQRQRNRPRRRGADEKPDPQEMMKAIATAIHNTSESIDTMTDHLVKDEAAKDVLKSLTTTVMSKLLGAKKEIEDMTVRLEVCLTKPETTRLIDEAKEVLGGDPDVALEVVKKAEERTSGSKKEVADLEVKLDKCRRKCDLLYHYRDEMRDSESAI